MQQGSIGKAKPCEGSEYSSESTNMSAFKNEVKPGFQESMPFSFSQLLAQSDSWRERSEGLGLQRFPKGKNRTVYYQLEHFPYARKTTWY